MVTFSPLLKPSSQSTCNIPHPRSRYILILPHIVLIHRPPVAPTKRHLWRAAKHLEHLPRKRGHHALERLMALVKVAVERAVVLVGLNDGVVRADLKHVLARLRGPAVDREDVVGRVDGAPVGEVELVRSLDLPVLDELLDEVGEALGGVVSFFGCKGGSVMGGGCALGGRRTLGPDLACPRVIGGSAVAPLCRGVLEDGVFVEDVVGEIGHFAGVRCVVVKRRGYCQQGKTRLKEWLVCVQEKYDNGTPTLPSVPRGPPPFYPTLVPRSRWHPKTKERPGLWMALPLLTPREPWTHRVSPRQGAGLQSCRVSEEALFTPTPAERPGTPGFHWAPMPSVSSPCMNGTGTWRQRLVNCKTLVAIGH